MIFPPKIIHDIKLCSGSGCWWSWLLVVVVAGRASLLTDRLGLAILSEYSLFSSYSIQKVAGKFPAIQISLIFMIET